MIHPDLPPEIVVLPGTDVEGAWERFHPFEALHHLHEICNPMRRSELSSVIDALGPAGGSEVVDVACGHGDLLIDMAARHSILGVGVDLSPWVLLRALARASAAQLIGRIELWLGEGAAVPRGSRWDIATCLGASWIWHGFAGTARALTSRLKPGGRLAIGDLRLRHAADRERLQAADAPEAATMTAAEQEATLTELDLGVITRIDAPDEAWEGYHQLVVDSARAYAEDHPDADYRHLATAWMKEFERDRVHLTWSVWVAQSNKQQATSNKQQATSKA